MGETLQKNVIFGGSGSGSKGPKTPGSLRLWLLNPGKYHEKIFFFLGGKYISPKD